MEESHSVADKMEEWWIANGLSALGIHSAGLSRTPPASDELLLFTTSSEGSDRGKETSAHGLQWILVSRFTDNLQTMEYFADILKTRNTAAGNVKFRRLLGIGVTRLQYNSSVLRAAKILLINTRFWTGPKLYKRILKRLSNTIPVDMIK